MRVFLCFLLFFCLYAAPRSAHAQTLTTAALPYNGEARTYHYYIPPHSLTAQTGLPLLIALHGGGGSGEKYAGLSGYSALAQKEGFIVVYPDSIGSQWNDGRPANEARRRSGAAQNADDVGFITALIEEFVKQHGVNADKIFVEGTSNGGMMAQRIACDIPGKIKGVASVIASMPVELYKTCHPDQPVGMLLMSGSDDPLMPYKGGEVTVFGRSYGQVIGHEATARFWAQQNDCRIPPETTRFRDRDPKDGTSISLDQYQGCRNHAPLWVYTVQGGGHTRPGLQHAPERRVGKTNSDIQAASEIWRFFNSL